MDIGSHHHRFDEAMYTDFTQLDWSWVTSHAAVWALVLARVFGVCRTAPAIVVPGLEWRFRLALSLMLSALIAPAVEQQVVPMALGPSVAWMAVTEAIVGGLLGWSAALIVAAARQAGELVSAQAGLSAAALFDPTTGDELTPLGHLYGLIALAVFLTLDGPIMLVGSMIESYQAVPPGGFVITTETVTQVFGQVGGALALSVRAAAPPAIALALAGIVMGWIGRLAPAVPILAHSLPVRVILGIVLISLSLASLAATFSQSWTHWAAWLVTSR
jgi:flagellar biosynthesis protein FliR